MNFLALLSHLSLYCIFHHPLLTILQSAALHAVGPGTWVSLMQLPGAKHSLVSFLHPPLISLPYFSPPFSFPFHGIFLNHAFIESSIIFKGVENTV